MSKKREKGRKERSKKGAYKIYQRDGEEMIRENIKSTEDGDGLCLAVREVFLFLFLCYGGGGIYEISPAAHFLHN